MPNIVISIYDSFENPYYSGGGPVVVHEVAKRLSKYFSITVLTGNFPGAKDYTKDNVQYKHIGSANSFLSLTSFQFLLPFYLSKQPFDLWIESFTPPYSTAFLPMFTRKPVIGLAHILSGEVMKSKYGLPFDLYEKAGVKLYPHIIVPTQQLATAVEHINPNIKIHVISNGVYQSDFCPLPSPEPYILFLGRLDWQQKGLDLLVKSYAIIKDRVKQKLYIAGHGTDKGIQYIKDIIHQNGLEDHIILKGRVDGDVKQALLANADFVAIPSRYEGMSLVALEACAFKKPIVCFDIPGFDWLLQRTVSFKAKPYDIKDFAQLMITLADDAKMRNAMGLAGFDLIRDLNWDTTAAEYKKVIEEALV